MIKSIQKTACILFILLLSGRSFSQMSGVFNIPGDFTTLAAAISSLSAVGISGPVTINVAAGYAETITAGYTLSVSGTLANPIIFQKSGVGANPLITAHTGTATPASAVQDGIWALVGSDYVTIDGIDLLDPNTTNPATMEYGFGLFRTNVGDGAQNNTIKNCVITLSKANNANSTNPAIEGSRGINMVSSLITTQTSISTPNAAAGANSNNKFYANTIQNCNYGIALIGYAASTPFTLSDTGNDIGGTSPATGNIIINYGGGGTTNPAAGIRTLAQQNLNVSYNTINNNNGAGINHAQVLRGIYVNTATSAVSTINNNTITLNGGGTTHSVTCIENSAGSTAASNAVNINNNLIYNCTYTTATSGAFTGIANTASSASLNVNNNVFNNNSTNATSGTYYNINTSGSVTSSVSIGNNTISVLTFSATTTGVAIVNINTSSSGGSSTVSINNNIIQNINANVITGAINCINSSATPSQMNINNNLMNSIIIGGTSTHALIETGSPGSTAVVNSNTITNVSSSGASGTLRIIKLTSPGTSFTGNNNLIDGISYTTLASAGNIDCMYGFSSSTSFTASNNIMRNISIPAAGTINGIREWGSAGNKTVQGNTISNFSCTAGGAGGGSFNGISMSVGSITITGNTVSGFNSAGATGITMNGIYITQSPTSSMIFKNKIYDLAATNGTAVTISGIQVSGGTTNTAYNNVIGGLTAPSAIGANVVIGINVTGGTTDNLYFNTVNLSSTATSTLFGSSAVNVNTSPTTFNVRNNIFVNTSAATGTGVTTAYRRGSTTLTNYATTSNNNLLYAGTASASNLLFYDGTNALQSLTAFKVLMSTRDALSVTENVSFVSIVGSNANFLNINSVTPTQIESGAATISGITDDYAGTVRNATSPDIGAWEGTYVLNDLTAPIASSGSLTIGCSVTAATYTTTIADNSGVASGGVAPRIYFKINAGAYNSAAGTLSSGTATNGVWTFNLSFSATSGDILSYYIAAQDILGNLGATPPSGFSGSNVNTITTPPTTPITYTVTGTLNGTYNVGAGQAFTSLTQAAQIYNTACLTGSVTFVLTDALYSAAETFPIVFQNNTNASATNSLLIKPNAGVVAVITGNSSAASVIKFLNARFITIDGLNAGGSSIIINNNNTGTASGIWLASTASTGPGNNTVGVKNLALNGSSNSSNYGIIAGVDGSTPSTTGGLDNDNITIQGNTILKVYNGIYVTGTTSLTAGGMDNLVITNNIVGPVASGANNIGNHAIVVSYALNGSIAFNTIQNIANNGIQLSNATGYSITSNLIQNLVSNTSGVAGIYVGSGVNGFSVSQNTITNLNSTGGTTTSETSVVSAIYAGSSVINGTISANNITGIYNLSSSGYGVKGMMINTSAAGNISIRNNFLSDIYSYSDATAAYWPIGIALVGSSGAINVDFNTVNLFGSHTGATGATGSAAMYINASGGTLNIRNNIFVSTYDNSTSTTDINYAIYSNVASTNFATINYNNYSVGGTGNVPKLGYLTSARLTLPAIQTGFGGNVNSQTITPVFTSNTDLHLLPINNVSLDNLGTPISGITTDIDNQVRNVTTPDIGADEYLVAICTAAGSGTVTPSSVSICTGQTFSLVANGSSTDLNITFQWQVSPTAGGTYTNVAGGSGATTTSYTSVTLPVGTYYMVLQSTCTSAGVSALSNEVAVTVNAVPTASITSNAPICSGSNLNLSGSTDVGTAYLWKGPGSYTSGLQNPVIAAAPASASGVYTLVTTLSNCTSTPVMAAIVVNATPPSFTLTPSSPTICAGSSQTISSNVGTASPTLVFGTQANMNSATTTSGGYPAPYSLYYGGQRMQILIRASELTAAGFAVGTPITSVQFPVVSLGSNWGSSSSLLNFQVNIGSTAITAISSFQTGLTNVQAPGNFTPTVGYNNTHNFSSPYIWDGNNVILETTFSNAISGLATDVVIQYNSPTTYSSCVVYRNDSESAATMAANTSTSFAYMARPDFKLNGLSVGTYSWNPGTGLSSTTSQSVVANPAASTVYTVTLSKSGCSSAKVVSVTVAASPTVDVVSTSTAICIGNSATLTASGASTYSWSTAQTNTNIIVSPTVTSNYTVTGYNGLCSASKTIDVIVNAGPTVGITASSATTCAGQSVTLTANGATGYTWTGSGATTTDVVVSPTATTVYTVTGSNGLCSATKTISIGVIANPTVTISPASPTVCSGGSTTLTAGGASTYSWSTAETTTNIIVSPTSTTVYTVTGTTGLCFAVQTVSVNYIATPTVAISASSLALCAGQSATLTASGATTYSWASGATTGSIVVSNTATTVYTVTGNNGICQSAQTVTITANPYPVVSAGSQTICAGGTATITASGANTYSWSDGSTANPLIVSPGGNTSYTVTGNSLGCTTTATAGVAVSSSLSIGIAASNPSICAGGATTLTASGVTSFTWDSGANTPTIAVNPLTTTSYSITGSNGSCSGSGIITVSVNAASTVTIVASPLSTVCAGAVVSLSVQGSYPTYTWSTGSATSVISVTPATTTNYTVTGFSPNGCSSSKTIAVVTNTLPVVAVSPSSASVCLSGSASFTASGASTYTWNTGITAASITLTPTGTTVYTVTGTNAAGCVASNTAAITTNSVPVVAIAQSATAVCISSPVTFTASGASTYTWSSAGNPNTAILTLSPSANTTYTVTGATAAGCIATNTVAVVTNSLPVIVIAQSATAVCIPAGVTFTASGASTYTWAVSGNPTTSILNANPTANTTYTVNGSNATGCSSSKTVAVVSNSVPVIAIAQSATAVCVSSPATFTASGASTYTWVVSGNPATNTLTVNPTANTVYSVNATSAAGCAGSGTVGVNTNTLPVIAIVQSATAVCVNAAATFTASGSNTYTWNVTGNPTTNTLTVNPTANTVYSVTGANAAGCIATKTVAVNTNTLPVIIVVQSATAVCLPSAATFTASGASTYTWNITGSPTTTILTVNPTANTVYTVTGASSAGCISTKTVGVNTNTVPIVTVAPASRTICSQSAASFTASGATSYLWSNNNATASLTVFPVNNTSYTVTGTNAQGCTTSVTVAVTTLSLPVIVVAPATTTVCPSAPTTFTASGADTYTWASSPSTGSTAVISTPAQTSYTVGGINANGCYATGSFIVFTNTVPVISVSAASPTICSLAPVDLTASGADTYVWSNTATGSLITVNPSGNTTYTVTGTNALTGCSDTETVAIVASALPTIGITASANTVCVNTHVILNGTGGDTYLWAHNSSINQTITVTPTANVTYTLTGTDLSGCSNTVTINITTNPLPVIVPGPAATMTICELESANLTVTGAGTYTWMPGNTNGAALTVTPAISTIYTITGVNSNNCKNTVTLSVKLDACTGIKGNVAASNVVSVFPNPTTGVFTAKFDFEGNKTITISNSIGQLINRVVTDGTSENFDLSGFAKGVYFVTVSSKQASGNYKIIVE